MTFTGNYFKKIKEQIKMKRIIVTAAFAGLISLAAQAQVMPERKNDGMQTERTTEKRGDVYKDLNLTKEQQQKLKAFREDGRSQMEAIRNDNSLTPEQKRAKHTELRESQKTKMNSILTPEQRTKMDAKMKEMKGSQNGKGDWKDNGEKRGMRKGGENGKKEGFQKADGTGKDANGLSRRKDNRSRGGNMANELNLDEKQKTQMKELNQETRIKMQAIRDNASLSTEQKKERAQEIMKETQVKRRSILTPEQQAKWEMNEKQSRANKPQRRGNFQNKI